MEILTSLLRAPQFRLAAVGTACLLSLLIVFAPQPLKADNERVITVFHDGIEQTVVTDAPNVREVLKRMEIPVHQFDSVEPALTTDFVASSYSINVYRARPITVVDGAKRYQIMSAHTSARKIAETAGLTLRNEDTHNLERIDNFLREDGVGLKLTIDRATPVNLVLYGKPSHIYTQATSVGDLLAEKKVTLGAADGMNVGANAPLTPNMTVEVWRDGEQTITEEQEIAFPVEQIRDADQPVGYKLVKAPGKKGKKLVTFAVELRNGKEVARKELHSVVTDQAVKQVEVIGAKKGVADPGANKILGHSMMLAAGFSESQWPCLLNLWNRESGWNQYKSNRQGSGAYGIPQALPGSKMGPGWQDDPVVQIRWGLGYIKSRYGTPCNAWNFFLSKNWY